MGKRYQYQERWNLCESDKKKKKKDKKTKKRGGGGGPVDVWGGGGEGDTQPCYVLTFK